MSVIVKKNNITMTRGDTARVDLKVYNDNGSLYTPVEGDVIRFAAKKSYADETVTILKDIPIDTLELVLEPEDTKLLDQPSTLVFDIQITMKDGTVDTFIKGTLKIEEEVE